MKNMLFSPSAVGFFLQGMDAPADAVEVSAAAEAFLREAIIWGADKFQLSTDSVTVSYPGWMKNYLADNDAPTEWARSE